MPKYKITDLFAGIGDIRLAFKKVFGDAETIFISEINPYARQTYTENFPNSVPIEEVAKCQSIK